ncbi:MAG: energy-coupling factor transporter ATPase, partial [Clostridia bacterium]|nr:energy-coupling factor transporter ATPase [Clostridia bacterium]
MENIIEFKQVSCSYEDVDGNENRAITNVSIEINQGDYIAVLGHNGSGKSTFAKLCNAILLPDEGEGTVVVSGIDTRDDEKLFEIRQSVGMVFQNPDNQIVATIVEDDVAFGPENIGVEPDEIRRRVDDALKKVDMYDYRTSEPHKLSGGQKQRVAIAGVIAMQPRCIIFDESTSMLDPQGRQEVLNTIDYLNKELGITIVLITHYMDEAVRARRVAVMNGGELIALGTPREIFSNVEQIKTIGLDVPQVTEIAFELNKHGFNFSNGILTVDD